MTRRLILALTPAALALATLAHAQPAPPPPGPPGAEMNARHDAMRTQRLEDLKTVLRIRPDQEPALAAFVAAHRPPPREDRGPRDGAKALTTPQRLDDMGKREAEMAAQHQRMRDGLARFYAALSPEQQKVFDALQRLEGPHGGPGGGPMMMRGGPGGGPRMLFRHGGPGGPLPEHEPPR
ncbi:MAG: Spy/CpxP family protein refolding chaperone [Alphaproteobacteria bacterium]|nr:Spy/CpxP family protein refolding chaperone [Alphaproteobacteria bacterium]MBU1515664.1 Spy/CpxP family protein refolding chaperone [Alphaproteobacteria bacterium]MBU2094923.1 Spy/CpxP family protein refolding chaperone [Alphaproteobacteria bacterium]MBU2150955.1 Spy/CpxP family protein refolding chaperone [Alphaproteobacteria bacterium]MBU2305932.1 Spy/CpxP family protein refolding chaperone [Alphaproteobacteria bacterium]